MFEQTFVQTGKTHTTWTVILSALIQTGLLVVAVILPMIYFDVLPAATLTSFLVAPPPPPPPPPPPAAVPVAPKVRVIPRQFDAGKLMTPKSIPKDIAQIREDDLPPTNSGLGVVGGVPGGTAGGAVGGVLGSILTQGNSVAPPPPPPKKEAPPPPRRVQIGGNVQAAMLLYGPKPSYPPLAKQARISGTVHLHAFISKEGTIQTLTVIPPAHPLLAPAAVEAVRTWRYKPTMLNGEPVEVETTIDVSFMLSQ
jgi:protein TonB